MNGKIFQILVICLFLSAFIVGCRSQWGDDLQSAESLFENPDPLPTYIAGFRFGNRDLCPVVKLGFFENTDAFPMDISLDKLVDKVEYSLDGWDVKAVGLGDSRFYFFSCFNIDLLPEGLHVATIRLTRFSGATVTYSWAFRVEGSLAGLSFEKLAEKVTLPDFP